MQRDQRVTLDQTIFCLKKAAFSTDKALVKQHLENLLYMKSVLYLDDKKNQKHLQRIQVVLDAIKKEYSKEWGEALSSEGAVSLVAQILFSNKIIDSGITRVKAMLERTAPLEEEPVEVQAKAIKSEPAPAVGEPEEKGPAPKLRETLGFLVSIVGDPLRTSSKTALHFSNLEKMSKLIKRKYQDPKVQKVNENILGILSKIYGSNHSQELNHCLDNSIIILKNLSQYKDLINQFETEVKRYLALAQAEREPKSAPSSREAHVDQFYAEFKEERNMIKKINMAKEVLTSAAYKYDKELNAASLRLIKGLEGMGLKIDLSLAQGARKI